MAVGILVALHAFRVILHRQVKALSAKADLVRARVVVLAIGVELTLGAQECDVWFCVRADPNIFTVDYAEVCRGMARPCNIVDAADEKHEREHRAQFEIHRILQLSMRTSVDVAMSWLRTHLATPTYVAPFGVEWRPVGPNLHHDCLPRPPLFIYS